jgi:hypothetical protein
VCRQPPRHETGLPLNSADMPPIAAKHLPRGFMGNQTKGWLMAFSRSMFLDHSLTIPH